MIDPLDIERLEREAMNRAGLEDFGTGDWREALGVLLDSAGWIFDRDPANRSLLTWFAKRPCPPPHPGSNAGD